MQIDDSKIKQIIEKFEHAIESIGSIESWLPSSIHSAADHAINGHSGLLDRVDIDRMLKERKEDEKNQTEINNLREQTREISKQTKYLFYTVIITLISSIVGIILQIDPSLLGLLKNNYQTTQHSVYEQVIREKK